MRKSVLILLFVFLTSGVYSKNDEGQPRVIKNLKMNVIQGIPVDKYVRIPPPESFNLKSGSSTNIIVTYHNFSVSAKKAFQYAVDIWAGLVTSSQPIYIDAYWKKLGARVLGSCGPTNYYMGYDGLLMDSTYFPTAVAEKLTKLALNDEGEPDLIANFSSDSEWYYGTDGLTPAGKYDLVTVVLHELCHGLGFTGSMNVESGIGSWGWGANFPFIFDHFLNDQATNSVLDTTLYPNNSAKLKTAITSGEVYFSGPYTISNYGKRVALYTPTSWDEGSSVYHVNTTFSTGTEKLMLPAVNTQTSVHNPGVVAQSILADLGWKSIDIQHTPISNSEKIENTKVAVRFESDFSTSFIKPTLHYSIDSAGYVDVDLVEDPATRFSYQATIPIAKSSDVSYYITVDDKFGRTYKRPVTAPEEGFYFYLGTDTVVPFIKHYPNAFLLKGQDSILVDANVNDDFGVDKVWIQFRLNEMESDSLIMDNVEDDKYIGTIDISAFNLQVNDSIEYRIVASDKSKAGNVAYFPEEGYIKMKVEEIPEFIPEYQNTFEGANHDFILQGFETNVPNGFESGALSTKHPYEFAGDNSTLNYIAQLRYPIKISESLHYLSFNEIVLVEPGEKGSVFGEQDFYDYVIVEGSSDEGKTWVPLEDGWDSRRDAEWESVYNQSLVSQYSQAIGTPSLYRSHLIDLTKSGDFLANDVVLLRFRLFSDPFAYGWGWAIDNLKIQTPGVSANVINDPPSLSFFPNPVSDGRISFRSKNQNGKLEVTLSDLQGTQLMHYNDVAVNDDLQLPEGLKGLFVLTVEDGQQTNHFKLLMK
jgi:hypothetical protein